MAVSIFADNPAPNGVTSAL